MKFASNLLIAVATTLTFTSAKAATPTTTAAATPSVSFIEPKDGAAVAEEFTVKFFVAGMTVAKAGEMKQGTGHHHLLIDSAPVPKGQAVAKDATHIHFGDGATETKLKLAKGKHTLTLQFADGAHLSYGPEMSKTITVNVK